MTTGSPPQVRVKDQAVLESLDQARITPAGAGKSSQNDREQMIR
ncbi:hypothetical protein RU87_GL001047 [Lactococcus plantarum]|uniref:Uncharacterized protein n=1 Tax=Pseudolactococcus plantarum TaxID=1365 RepID=A0A2A5S1T2_9LACT|nr:hypothetical protein RU87_GL001047 [Lactococcus plantarum]